MWLTYAVHRRPIAAATSDVIKREHTYAVTSEGRTVNTAG
jgi:hypothetical protein